MTWLDLLEEAKQKLSLEERQQLALALWQSLDPPALPDDEIHPLTPEPMTGAEIVAAGLTGTLPDLPDGLEFVEELKRKRRQERASRWSQD